MSGDISLRPVRLGPYGRAAAGLAVFIGLTIHVPIGFGIRLALLVLSASAGLGVLKAMTGRGRQPRALVVLLLSLGVYIAGQFLSDLLNGVEGLLLAKSLGRLISIAVVAIGIQALHEDKIQTLRYIFFGYMCGRLVIVFLDPPTSDLWRSGIGEAVVLGALALVPARAGLLVAVPLLATLGGISIFQGFRGMAVATLATAAYLTFLSGSTMRRRLGRGVAMAAVIAAAFGALWLYALAKGAGKPASDSVRILLVRYASADLIRPSLLGHGYQGFDEEMTAVSDSRAWRYLSTFRGGSTPMHGYFWIASWEAGKLGMVFYLTMLGFSGVFLWTPVRFGKAAALHPIAYFLCFYGMVASFTYVLVDFDRYLVAFWLVVLANAGRLTLGRIDRLVSPVVVESPGMASPP